MKAETTSEWEHSFPSCMFTLGNDKDQINFGFAFAPI